ncbi:hypothetical protein GCM10010104_15430 [Streptomyces indiaensis]|uniref:Uncharacterized protein n=1 Tax=Streptomyces indiaensis TaxID=284033 RepID=A0ABN3D9M5_9ACTN
MRAGTLRLGRGDRTGPAGWQGESVRGGVRAGTLRLGRGGTTGPVRRQGEPVRGGVRADTLRLGRGGTTGRAPGLRYGRPAPRSRDATGRQEAWSCPPAPSSRGGRAARR